MLSSLELNRCLICDAFYGKGIVKRNYLKREDFPHCTVRSLAVWLTMLQNVTSSVSLGSPVWLFHCGINGRTELISCTDCWASHLSIEIHIFCKDWDLWGYFLNGNLPYIFISLDVYKDIWKEAVQRMVDAIMFTDIVLEVKKKSLWATLLFLCLVTEWLYFPKKIGLTRGQVLRIKYCWLKLVLWMFPFSFF